jgi:hypothetical protein
LRTVTSLKYFAQLLENPIEKQAYFFHVLRRMPGRIGTGGIYQHKCKVN